MIFCDGQTGLSTLSELHTSFQLSSGSGAIALTRLYQGRPQVLDFVDYTGITPDHSYGDYPDGQPFTRQEFFYVTPGGANNAGTAPVQVFVNEWMSANTATIADPADGQFDDWFELYNAGPNAAYLHGFYLSNNTTNKFQYQITNATVIPAGGFMLVWADKEPQQNSGASSDLHANFHLPKSGASIGLFTPDGSTVDFITYAAQPSDVSAGRYPDGAERIYNLLSTPTPRGPNSVPGNQPPVLTPLPDRAIFLGQTLSFMASATDPDSGETLSYALDAGFPAGAAIDPTSGLFHWTPSAAQAPSTNQITVTVTDNGAPNLSDRKSFSVVVALQPRVAVGQALGVTTLTFPLLAGKIYHVKYSGDLNLPISQWPDLVPSFIASANGTRSITDNAPGQSQRFYLIFVE